MALLSCTSSSFGELMIFEELKTGSKEDIGTLNDWRKIVEGFNKR